MNKQGLITSISEKSKLTKKDAEAVLKAFIESVEETLERGEKVSLVGFGTFEAKDVAERSGVSKMKKDEKGNVIEEPWTKPAHKEPKFKASKEFKDRIAK